MGYGTGSNREYAFEGRNVLENELTSKFAVGERGGFSRLKGLSVVESRTTQSLLETQFETEAESDATSREHR